jgi:hypothetical protein
MVSTDDSNLLVSPGDNIDLICRVAGQTFPDIRWFKGNEPVRIFYLKISIFKFCKRSLVIEQIQMDIYKFESLPKKKIVEIIHVLSRIPLDHHLPSFVLMLEVKNILV